MEQIRIVWTPRMVTKAVMLLPPEVFLWKYNPSVEEVAQKLECRWRRKLISHRRALPMQEETELVDSLEQTQLRHLFQLCYWTLMVQVMLQPTSTAWSSSLPSWSSAAQCCSSASAFSSWHSPQKWSSWNQMLFGLPLECCVYFGGPQCKMILRIFSGFRRGPPWWSGPEHLPHKKRLRNMGTLQHEKEIALRDIIAACKYIREGYQEDREAFPCITQWKDREQHAQAERIGSHWLHGKASSPWGQSGKGTAIWKDRRRAWEEWNGGWKFRQGKFSAYIFQMHHILPFH